MEKIWHKNYQSGVPASIEDQMENIDSIPDLLEESFKKFSPHNAFHCMGKDLTFGEVDVASQNFSSYLVTS